MSTLSGVRLLLYILSTCPAMEKIERLQSVLANLSVLDIKRISLTGSYKAYLNLYLLIMTAGVNGFNCGCRLFSMNEYTMHVSFRRN